MGSALAHILKEQGHQISLFDRKKEQAESLSREVGAPCAKTPLEGLQTEDLLVLAIKPNDFEEALASLQEFSGALVISVLTGITLAQLKKAFRAPVLRMMPNLAIRYGEGVVACMQDPALEGLKKTIDALLAPMGEILWIQEEAIHALTALGGSGPAFIFMIVEAMIDAALAMGLSADMGRKVAIQTIKGAMTTLESSHRSPGDLKWQVTSPGGTTIAGVRQFEESGIKSGLIKTFLAAYERSRELSK